MIGASLSRLWAGSISKAEPVTAAVPLTGDVHVRDVRMRYGAGDTAVDALKGVTLSVRAGELLMIRGPSGSGKTTLLQLMGALKTPTSGNVTICGTPTISMDAEALRRFRSRHIGFVFQAFNLFPTLSAWENVAVALDLVGCAREAAAERSRTLLQTLGLGARMDFKPEKLSGGQKQRVAIARALAHEPPVILADEPTAALDRDSGAIVMETLQRLAHADGRAVVVVSHDSRVEAYMDRIVTIEDGQLL